MINILCCHYTGLLHQRDMSILSRYTGPVLNNGWTIMVSLWVLEHCFMSWEYNPTPRAQTEDRRSYEGIHMALSDGNLPSLRVLKNGYFRKWFSFYPKSKGFDASTVHLSFTPSGRKYASANIAQESEKCSHWCLISSIVRREVHHFGIGLYRQTDDGFEWGAQGFNIISCSQETEISLLRATEYHDPINVTCYISGLQPVLIVVSCLPCLICEVVLHRIQICKVILHRFQKNSHACH